MDAETLESYRQLIRKMANSLVGPEAIPQPSFYGLEVNPKCGDTSCVSVHISGDILVEMIVATQGCELCKASGALMHELVTSRSRHDTLELIRIFRAAIISPPESAWPAQLEKLIALSPLRKSRLRTRCVLLPWAALEKALPA